MHEVVVPVQITEQEKTQALGTISKTESEVASMGKAAAQGSIDDRVTLMRKYLTLGQQYEQLGRLSDAEASYTKATQAYPQGGIAFGNLGSLYSKMHNYKAAKTAFDQAVTLEPGSVLLWQKLLEFYRLRLHANDGEMRGRYFSALAGTSNDLSIRLDYAQYLEGYGDVAGALLQYREAQKQSPGNTFIDVKVVRLAEKLRTGN
jgi:tetratricopeptide (TPR) repeat protein